jgi:beta-lactamase class D
MRAPLLVLPVLLLGALAGCARSSGEGPGAGVAPAAASVPADTVDLRRFFDGMEGTFVLWDAQTQQMRRYNPVRARTRFLPASTFKIPNTLIALETGVASGPDFTLGWDSVAVPAQPWWPSSWRRAQTLEAAFRNSVYWYYQELARRVGAERMRAYLAQFAYGNQDLSGGVDRFWLEGGLRISPEEQVDFLRRFYEGRLGVSARATATLTEIMVLEETPAYRLSGKTGTADVTPTRELGWLVGYVERGASVSFFALNMEGETVWEAWPPQRRAELVKAILAEMDVLPADAAAPAMGG